MSKYKIQTDLFDVPLRLGLADRAQEIGEPLSWRTTITVGMPHAMARFNHGSNSCPLENLIETFSV